MWNGGKSDKGTYVLVRAVGHPRARGEGHYVPKHVIVMEKHLGRKLRGKEQVHHKNENPKDNRLSNLTLFPSSKEHLIEHRKLRAFKACGNRDWLVCRICGKYDAPKKLRVYRRSDARHCLGAEHRKCRQEAKKKSLDKTKYSTL